MNLFILDADPKMAAQYYQDLHINKIIKATWTNRDIPYFFKED